MRRQVTTVTAAASLAVCLAALALIWHSTRDWHYYADYTTYANDGEFGFRHDGVCHIKLVDGQFSAVRHRDDRLWLHAREALRARRGEAPAGQTDSSATSSRNAAARVSGPPCRLGPYP